MTSAAREDRERRGPITALAASGATQPHWDGLAQGELLIPRCRSCGKFFFYPRVLCPRCASRDIEAERVSGRGTIIAATTVHAALNGWPADDLPYTAVLVRLREGVVMPGRMADTEVGVVIGAEVQVRFSGDPEHELPRWAQG